MDLWKRSVKRKYDSSISEESQKSQRNDGIEPSDKVFFKDNYNKCSNTNSLELSSMPALEVENNLDAEIQQLYKKKESQHFQYIIPMDTIDISRDRALEKGVELNHATKNTDDISSPFENELVWQARKTEHKVLDALYMELEEERNASAIAANEAINMIARLQEEKAALQLEAQHYKMVADGRGAHDEEAIVLLKDVLMRKEEDIFDLEDELEAYRQVFRRFELVEWEKESCQRILSEVGRKDLGVHLLEDEEESTYMSDCFDTTESSRWHTSEEAGNRPSNRMEIMDQIYQVYPGCLVSNNNGRKGFTNNIDAAMCSWEDKHRPLDAPGKVPVCKTRISEISESLVPFSGHIRKRVARNPLKRAFYLSGSAENSREKKAEDLEFGEDILDVKQFTRLDREGTTGPNTEESQAKKKTILGVSFPTYATEEQEDEYVWERLRSLEDRIDHLGEQQKHQKVWLNENISYRSNEWAANEGKAFVLDSNEAAKKHWKQLKARSLEIQSSGRNSTNTIGGSPTANEKHNLQFSYLSENSAKLSSHQYLGPGNAHLGWKRLQRKGLQYDLRNVVMQDIHTEELSSQEWQNNESQGSCIEEYGDAGEGVHDVFEVHCPFERSRSSLFEESLKNDAAGSDSGVCPGILDLSEGDIPSKIGEGCFPDESGMKTMLIPVKQSPIDCKLGLVTDPILQSVTDKCQSAATLDGIDDQTSIPGKAVQKLALRLQALETERFYMKEAIESLRKENGELKLLQHIAQQLRELKGTAEKSEQPKERLQQEQLSILSFFKNVLAFPRLQCNIHPQNLKLGNSVQKNSDSRALCGEHVGLSFLLESSSDSRMAACVTRGIKVKLPFGEEPHISNIFSEVST